MSLDNASNALSNVNAILGSGLTYQQRLQNGEALGPATTEFGMNIFTGALRNQAAKDIKHSTGSDIGYLINNLAGYGTPEANAKGTAALLGTSLFASSMMSPWGYGPYLSTPMFYGGIFSAYTPPPMPMPYFGGASFFGGGGFWC